MSLPAFDPDPNAKRCPACRTAFGYHIPASRATPFSICDHCGHVYIHEGGVVRSMTAAERVELREYNERCGGGGRQLQEMICAMMIG